MNNTMRATLIWSMGAVRSEGDTWTTGAPNFATDVVAETASLDDAALLHAIEECRGQA